MTLKEAYEIRRKEVLSLKAENARLVKENGRLKEGTYVDADRMAHEKQIRALERENSQLKKERDRYRQLYKQTSDTNDRLRIQSYTNDEVERIRQDYEDQIKRMKREHDKEISQLQKQIDKQKYLAELFQGRDEEKQGQIEALKNETARLAARLDTDGTTSSLPTSRTPLDKDKVRPNSREKTGRKRGGQKGHKKSAMPECTVVEETRITEHSLNQCPACGGELSETGKVTVKDEIDYEVRVIRHQHKFVEYTCRSCGRTVRQKIPNRLKEQHQYGARVQALAIGLTNIGFVSMKRVRQLICGIFGGKINPCEAYISKLQRRASMLLQGFVKEVKKYIMTVMKVVHWDDTVIFINTARSCMRFYGDRQIALYTAHNKKDKEGLDEDGILVALGPDVKVIHDHNTINYNPEYVYQNGECNGHLLRELLGLFQNSGHEWTEKLRTLIQSALHERNEILRSGGDRFPKAYLEKYNKELDKLLDQGAEAYARDHNRYYGTDERRILNRLGNESYRKAYTCWTEDFNIPPTNNEAERSLRGIKTKSKVSGQFWSVKTAKYFADIRTYIECCYRNGINPFEALTRLMSGTPYTLAEVLEHDGC